MKEVSEYIQANKDRFLNELIELLKIPSVRNTIAIAAGGYVIWRIWNELEIENTNGGNNSK